MQEFNNTRLRDVLRDFKADRSQENINKMGSTLEVSHILVPTIWDKEPKINERGQMLFEPNTNFQFALLKTKDGNSHVITFTSHYDYKRWDEKKIFKPMVIPVVSLIDLISNVSEDVKGIFIDPTDVQVPIPFSFLSQVMVRAQAQKTVVKQNLFEQQKLVLIEPKNADELKGAIVFYGKNEPSIQSIYLKERAIDNDKNHWLVIVEADQEDTKLFQGLGEVMRPFSKNMQMEFMFASQQVSQQIIAQNKPVYVKK